MKNIVAYILWFWNSLTTYAEGDSKVSEAVDAEDGVFGDDFDLDDPDPESEEEEEVESEEEEGEEEEFDGDDDGEEADDDDDEDEEEVESEEEDTDSEGEGDDEEGVDPAVQASIRRNWETTLEARKGQQGPDLLQRLRDTDVQISDDVRAVIKKKFEDEDDIGAIQEAVREILPQVLGVYDETRLQPVLGEVENQQRTQRLVSNVRDFDAAYPGARTNAINEKMGELYKEFREKYGYKAADAVPVQDYFVMAGGSLRSKGKSRNKPKGSSKRKKAEKRKADAVRATRVPDKVARTSKPGGKRKRGKNTEVDETFAAIGTTRRNPFNMP